MTGQRQAGALALALAVAAAGCGTPLQRVALGGEQQAVYVIDEAPAAPVLVVLHGGPGGSEMTHSYVYDGQLRQHFRIVHWDQRGAARSYDPDKPPKEMSLARIAADAEALIAWAKRRFGVDKVYLLGHSWGTLVGALVAARRPELLHAYVGVGQGANMARGTAMARRLTLERARAAGDAEAVASLALLGADDGPLSIGLYARFGGNFAQGEVVSRFEALGKASPLPLPKTAGEATMFSLRALWDDLWQVDLVRDAPAIGVPVWVLQGRADLHAPPGEARAYFEALKAPSKRWVWFERSAHWPQLEEPGRFQEVMVCEVLGKTSASICPRR